MFPRKSLVIKKTKVVVFCSTESTPEPNPKELSESKKKIQLKSKLEGNLIGRTRITGESLIPKEVRTAAVNAVIATAPEGTTRGLNRVISITKYNFVPEGKEESKVGAKITVTTGAYIIMDQNNRGLQTQEYTVPIPPAMVETWYAEFPPLPVDVVLETSVGKRGKPVITEIFLVSDINAAAASEGGKS